MSDDTGSTPTGVKRYHWERHLIAADAEPLTKLVGFVLATHTDGATGRNAHPGIENLRRECGVGNERTIRRHLAKLVELGLIERVFRASRAGRGGLADKYELRVPDATTGLESHDHRTPESEPVDPGVHPSVPCTNAVSHHSAPLSLAHDESRADEGDKYEEAIEDVKARVEAWSQATYGCGLDTADHQLIDGMASSGEHPRLIENTAKARIRGFEEAYPPGDPWATAGEVPF